MWHNSTERQKWCHSGKTLETVGVSGFDHKRAPYSITRLHTCRKALHERWRKANHCPCMKYFSSISQCWLLFEIVIEATAVHKLMLKIMFVRCSWVWGKASEQQWGSFFFWSSFIQSRLDFHSTPRELKATANNGETKEACRLTKQWGAFI